MCVYFHLKKSVFNSEGAYSLLTDGKQPIGSHNWSGLRSRPLEKCSDSYNITTYGTTSLNDWHASSIRPNLNGGCDYTLVCKDGFFSCPGCSSALYVILFLLEK